MGDRFVEAGKVMPYDMHPENIKRIANAVKQHDEAQSSERA